MVLSHSTWSITPKKVLRWVLRTGSEFSFDIGKWACDPSSIYIYSYRRQTGEWGKMDIDRLFRPIFRSVRPSVTPPAGPSVRPRLPESPWTDHGPSVARFNP